MVKMPFAKCIREALLASGVLERDWLLRGRGIGNDWLGLTALLNLDTAGDGFNKFALENSRRSKGAVDGPASAESSLRSPTMSVHKIKRGVIANLPSERQKSRRSKPVCGRSDSLSSARRRRHHRQILDSRNRSGNSKSLSQVGQSGRSDGFRW